MGEALIDNIDSNLIRGDGKARVKQKLQMCRVCIRQAQEADLALLLERA